MITLTVRYLSNTYHGVEYPPSPGRVFSALVAGGHTGAWAKYWQEFEPAIHWIESQSDHPPVIRFVPARKGLDLMLSTPTNDADLWAKEQMGSKKKKISRDEMRSVVREHTWSGDGLLVASYTWQNSPSDSAVVDALSMLARTVTHVGLGRDIAMVSTLPWEDSDAEVWVPREAPGLQRLNVPMTGAYAALERNWVRRANMLRTSEVADLGREPVPWRRVAYGDAEVAPEHQAIFEILALGGHRNVANVASSLEVAAWLRHTVRSWLEGRVDGMTLDRIMGHVTKGHKTRIEFLPLPTVGTYGDGGIRRVMIYEDVGDDGPFDDDLWAMLRNMSGSELTDAEGNTMAYLGNRIDRDSVSCAYTEYHREWVTVSPIVLPTHGSVREALIGALRHAGIDPTTLEGYDYSRSPLIRGTERIERYRVANYMGQPRFHFRLRFKVPLRGPLSLGTGRYYGIGLCVGMD